MLGRKTMGPKLAENAAGSALAKQRLRLILETVSGQIPIPQACEELGISEAMFHKMRTRFIDEAAGLLEPRKSGPKAEEISPEQAKIERLESQVRELSIDLEASRIRTELALVMPHVLKSRLKKNEQPSPPSPPPVPKPPSA